MSALAQLVAQRGLALLDGGLATELQHRGCNIEGHLWSARVLLDDPDAIIGVHADYLEAGADIITSATYQATIPGLLRQGLPPQDARRVMLDAMHLAQQARDAHRVATGRRALVAASIGSFGAHLADGSEYRGDYGLSPRELGRFHRERLELLAPHADVIAFETIPSVDEVRALVAELERLGDVEGWLSLSCPAGDTVGRSDALHECVDELHRSGAITAIGVNCMAPHLAENLVARIRSRTDKLIIVYPNSGESWEHRWHGDAMELAAFVELAATWARAGARIIGGCCRTGPAHIAALARWRQSVMRAGSMA